MPRTIHLSWTDLIARLPIRYLLPSEANIRANAKKQSDLWCEIFERNAIILLTQLERSEIEAVFTQLVTDHWKINNVLSGNLDLGHLVRLINTWARKPSSGASDRRLPHEDAIFSWRKNSNGVVFELTPAFVTAYVEARHCAHSVVDEGLKFKDVTAKHLLDTWNNIFEGEGLGPITLELRYWDYSMVFPQYSELETLIQALREKPKGDINVPSAEPIHG